MDNKRTRFVGLFLGMALSMCLLCGFFIAKSFADSGSASAISQDSKSELLDTQWTVTAEKTGTTAGTSVTLDRSTALTGQDVVLTWKGATSGNDFIVPVSVSVNGKTTWTMDALNKIEDIQTLNTEYKRRMKQIYTITEYDTLKPYITKGNRITIPNITMNTTIQVNFSKVQPVYRLYNMVSSEHLFTTNKTEYDNWVAKCKKDQDFWIGEGIDWLAPTTSDTKVVHRLYNAGLGALGRSSHYYVADTAEINNLIKNWGWKDEGSSYQFRSGGSTPIYTCYNEALNSAHHYTSSKTEWEGLKNHGWDLEKTKNGSTGVFQCMMGTNWSFSSNYYTVEHKIKNSSGSYVTEETQVVAGVAGKTTAATAKTYTGYSASTFNQKTIAKDNSTIVTIYYNPVTYAAKFDLNGHGIDSQLELEQKVEYGSKIVKPALEPVDATFNFDGWYTDADGKNAYNFDTPMPSNDVTLYAKWTIKNTDTTNDNGEAKPGDPSVNKAIVVTVSYDSDSTANFNEVFLPSSEVVVANDGSVNVKLPSVGDDKDIKVKLAYSDGTLVTDRQVTLEKSSGESRGTKKTDNDGIAFFPNNNGITDGDGKEEVFDPKTKEFLDIEVLYDDDDDPSTSDKPLQDATIEVDDEGKVTVKVPDDSPANGKDMTVKVEVDGNPKSDVPVIITDDKGTRGPKDTDNEGIADFPGYSDKTGNEEGKSAVITDPTTGKEYTVTVACPDDETLLDGAIVSIDKDENGKPIITAELPKASTDKVIVKVTTEDEGVADIPVVVKDKISEAGRGPKATDEDGRVEFDGVSGKTDGDGKAEINDEKSGQRLKVVVTYSPEDDGQFIALEGAVVTTAQEHNLGDVFVTIPEDLGAKGHDVKVFVSADDKPLSGKNVMAIDKGEYEVWRSTDLKTTATDGTVLFATHAVKFVTNVDSANIAIHGAESQTVRVNDGRVVSNPYQGKTYSNGDLVINAWYTDTALTSEWDFNTPVSEDKTLYAEWGVSDTCAYWIAPASKITTDFDGNFNKDNSAYKNEVSKVKKSPTEIQEDIAKIKTEISNGTYLNGNSVYTEYKNYMTNDNYHLYTNISQNGGNATNDYVEFRVINVGQHDSDGSTLTFQATHALPNAYQFNAASNLSNTDTLGWGGSDLRASMNKSGEIFNLFNSGLANDIQKNTSFLKKYTLVNSDTVSTSKDVFWIAAASEYHKTSSARLNKEGSVYQYWADKDLDNNSLNNDAFVLARARDGQSVNGTNKNYAWLRSLSEQGEANTCYVMKLFKMTTQDEFANSELGVVPCFAF